MDKATIDLFMGIYNQDIKAVREAVENGANVNYKLNVNSEEDTVALHPNFFFDGDTPLYIAVSNGDISIVEFLVEKRADLKHRNHEGDTLLLAALQSHNPNPAMIFHLLQYPEVLNTINVRDNSGQASDGQYPLDAAIDANLGIKFYSALIKYSVAAGLGGCRLRRDNFQKYIGLFEWSGASNDALSNTAAFIKDCFNKMETTNTRETIESFAPETLEKKQLDESQKSGCKTEDRLFAVQDASNDALANTAAFLKGCFSKMESTNTRDTAESFAPVKSERQQKPLILSTPRYSSLDTRHYSVLSSRPRHK